MTEPASAATSTAGLPGASSKSQPDGVAGLGMAGPAKLYLLGYNALCAAGWAYVWYFTAAGIVKLLTATTSSDAIASDVRAP